MKYKLETLIERASGTKKPKETHKKPEKNVRIAEEYQYPQSQQNRKDVHSGTEKSALKNVDFLHTTPRNNVQNKKAAIFKFVPLEEQDGSLQCDCGDGYIIHVTQTGKFGAWEASYRTRENTKRASLQGFGHNRAMAISRLLGQEQFWNRHSWQWLSFYDVCEPHLVIPKHNNMPPRESIDIPTQESVNAINISITSKSVSEIGRQHYKESLKTGEITLRMRIPYDIEEEQNNLLELHEALEKNSNNRI